MKKLLSALLLTSCIFSQDVLTTLSGKTYSGEFVGELDDKKVMFRMKGNKVPTPIVKNSIKQILLNNGEIIVFWSIMRKKDGSEVKGNWIMTSLDSVKFTQDSDGRTLNFSINNIDYIKKGDKTFIDLTLVTNPDQQDEWENRKYIEKLLAQCEDNKSIKVIVMPIKDDL